MWICLRDSFLSIVAKDCGSDELLVRARRAGDIQKVFGRGKAIKVMRCGPPADYRFRAVVKLADVQKAIAREIGLINYPNFKDAVGDDDLHDAYLAFWREMFLLQTGKRNQRRLFGERA